MLAALQSVALKRPPATVSPPVAAYALLTLPSTPQRSVLAAYLLMMLPAAAVYRAARGSRRRLRLVQRAGIATKPARQPRAMLVMVRRGVARPRSRTYRLNARHQVAHAKLALLVNPVRGHRQKPAAAQPLRPRLRGPAHAIRQIIVSSIIAYTIHLKRKVTVRPAVPFKVRRRAAYRVFYPIGMPFIRLAHAATRLRRRAVQPARLRRPRNLLHAALLAIVHRALKKGSRRAAPTRAALRFKRVQHLWLLLSGLARGHRAVIRRQLIAAKPRRRFQRLKGALLGPVVGYVRGRSQRQPLWRRLLPFGRQPLRRRARPVTLPAPSANAPRLYFTATLDPTMAFGAPLDQALRSLATLDSTTVLPGKML
jgi:hypothetical protein